MTQMRRLFEGGFYLKVGSDKEFFSHRYYHFQSVTERSFDFDCIGTPFFGPKMRRFLEGGAYSSEYGIWSEGLKFKPIGRPNKDHRLSHNIVIWGLSRHYSSGYC